MQKMKCSWKENMTFVARDELGHEVLMDLGEESGGDNAGFRPMPLLLAGLGGCMGVDVKIILDKMKVSLTGLDLEIEADMDESTVPRIYEEIRVVFKFSGDDLEMDKLERAIKLAEEKYCNVSAILGKTCKLVYKAKIL
ncbi:OsmC family protein [Gudongella sp. SC589]|jgi:putative redox protein|uniref:OsmC family protein n=1 Tax=Gudongella sp. SC589 TaxID=3385990 RepID=UPI0039046F69